MSGCRTAGDNVLAVSFAPVGNVRRLHASSKVRTVGVTPFGGLDGIIRIGDGFALSSHLGAAVYAMHINGGVSSTIMSSIAQPADFGYDSKRH